MQLEKNLDTWETQRSTEARSIRTIDRTVKDLESQIQRREKQNTSLAEDLNKARDKISNLLATIDELQTSDSGNQLAAKRAERELREEREQKLRLERELEGWKSLRFEKGSARDGLEPPRKFLESGSQSGSLRGRHSALSPANSQRVLSPARVLSPSQSTAAGERGIMEDGKESGLNPSASMALPPGKQLRRVSGNPRFL
jgi:myosin protein heavy chain